MLYCVVSPCRIHSKMYRIMVGKTNQKFACMNPLCFRQIGFGEGSPRTSKYFCQYLQYRAQHIQARMRYFQSFPCTCSVLVPCTDKVVHSGGTLLIQVLRSVSQAHLPNSARWAALTLIDLRAGSNVCKQKRGKNARLVPFRTSPRHFQFSTPAPDRTLSSLPVSLYSLLRTEVLNST